MDNSRLQSMDIDTQGQPSVTKEEKTINKNVIKNKSEE